MRTLGTLFAAAALLAFTGQVASAQTSTRSTTTTTSHTDTPAGSVTTNTTSTRAGSDDGSTTHSTTTRSTTIEGPGASEHAPGHEATDARPANADAPGQVKKTHKSTSASEYSPGHQEHTDTSKETTTTTR